MGRKASFTIMEKLLTIVIPAYNMEKYLHRCLDSIIVESVMDRVQVIVANDGSKDRTSEIAHEYEHKYPNYIQVVDKENGNYGSCMNVGLSLAKGKYFRTLDADDWYDKPSFEMFVNQLKDSDADVLVCERFHSYEGTAKQELKKFEGNLVLNKDIEITKELWNNKSVLYMTHVSSVVYKTDIIRKSGLVWDEKVFYSDNEYLTWPIPFLKTIRLVALPVYVYLLGRGGQSMDPRVMQRNFSSRFTVTKSIVKHFTETEVPDNLKPYLFKVIKMSLFEKFYISLITDGLKNQAEIDEIEAIIKDNQPLLNLSAEIDNYRNLRYVEAYRNNRLKYRLIRFDYLLRSNLFLRKLFGK